MNRQLGRRDSYGWEPKAPRFIKKIKENFMVPTILSGKKKDTITEPEIRLNYIYYILWGSKSDIPFNVINSANNKDINELITQCPICLDGKTFVQ